MKKLALLLSMLALYAVPPLQREVPSGKVENEEASSIPTTSYVKAYLYGSSYIILSPLNAGVSVRLKENFVGLSLDACYSFFFLADVLDVSGNILGYTSKEKESFYGSIGLSHFAARYPHGIDDDWNVRVHKAQEMLVPIRIGYESSVGFTDVGALFFRSGGKTYFIPEVRGGIGFTF